MVPALVVKVTCPCPVEDWTLADCGALALVFCRSIRPYPQELSGVLSGVSSLLTSAGLPFRPGVSLHQQGR
jgi:hypothetical protein